MHKSNLFYGAPAQIPIFSQKRADVMKNCREVYHTGWHEVSDSGMAMLV